MQILPLCVLIVVALVFAQHETTTDTIDRLVSKCVNSTPDDGYLTVAYVTVDPYFYRRIEPFNVNKFEYNQDKLGQNITYFTEVVLQVSCICQNITLNGHDFVVNPIIIDEIPADALTLCVFHDDMNDVFDVLDIPRQTLQMWMVAQFMARMPQSTYGSRENFTSNDCVDSNGHPATKVLGQTTCYYSNYAKFQKSEDGIQVEHKVYYGPFLGSQFPNFTALSSGITTKALDIVTIFNYVECAMLKTLSRLSPDTIKTGCNHRFFAENSINFGMMACCCLGHEDSNCRDVNDAIKEKKILCLNGTLEENPRFYFAKECHFTVTKKYHRTSIADSYNPLSFEHLQALMPKDAQPSFDSTATCSSTATTCENKDVAVIEKGCCRSEDFCGVHHGLNKAVQRCYWSYGEDQKEEGCYVIFYRADNQWHLSSPIWFNMKTSKLYYLYSSRVGSDDYYVLLGFLEEKAMTKSCDEKKKHEAATYYVIHCASLKCDWNFQTKFFKQLDKKIVYDAVEKARIPRCENGSWTATTDATNEEPLVPKPKTTRLVGQYCTFRLIIEYLNDKKTVSMTFEPMFTKPSDCNTHHKDVDGRFVFTCCYEANHNSSYIDPNCHYSTILSIVEALQQTEESNGDSSVTNDAVVPAASIRQRVGENADACEQNGAVGYHGKPSRRCTPGGKGCFHVNGFEHPKDAVIASCIGRGEKLMATSKDVFDRYHEALICLTEEAKGQCHAVYDGTRWRKLCCCEVSTERKHVSRCKEDSNLLYHENQYVAKRVKEFRDDDGDDKK